MSTEEIIKMVMRNRGWRVLHQQDTLIWSVCLPGDNKKTMFLFPSRDWRFPEDDRDYLNRIVNCMADAEDELRRQKEHEAAERERLERHKPWSPYP